MATKTSQLKYKCRPQILHLLMVRGIGIRQICRTQCHAHLISLQENIDHGLVARGSVLADLIHN